MFVFPPSLPVAIFILLLFSSCPPSGAEFNISPCSQDILMCVKVRGAFLLNKSGYRKNLF